ncbi:MAG: acetoacetate metabolism regulatory protein AtoC [Deltaproteobacteria bacterium]|nr:MAG: acetoacetate metabolism regulatory protein AtoC [Deltaproteobacteria bacterium]
MRGKVILLSRDERLKKDFERALTEDIEFYAFSEVEKVGDADVIFLDVDSFGLSSLGLLKEKAFVIIVTAQRGARYLIESMTFGAFDCVFRPLDRSKVRESLERALGIRSELEGELIEFPGEIEGSSVTCAIVGNSPALQEICKLIGQVGRVDVPVLITGESGTGKDLVAESIWKVSTRWEKPFVVINCAAIPETLLEAELFGYEKGAFTGATTSRIGKFEEANGGVVFLDEIGDMSLPLQAKVLRVLQNGTFTRLGDNREIKVDIRIIAATNKNLEELVRQGKFREDLYFRINVVRIHLPTLTERKEDIPLLLECFTRRYSVQMGKEIKGATAKFLTRLMEYDWPGNIRELENTVRKAIAFAKTPYLTSYDLDLGSSFSMVMQEPSSFVEPLRNSVRSLLYSRRKNGNIYGEILKETERVLLEEALSASGWNRSKAARLLGINRLTLRRKLEEYRLDFPKTLSQK